MSPEVKSALLELCRTRLKENGITFWTSGDEQEILKIVEEMNRGDRQLLINKLAERLEESSEEVPKQKPKRNRSITQAEVLDGVILCDPEEILVIF